MQHQRHLFCQKQLPFFQSGDYQYHIETRGTVEYILVTISAKSINDETSPIVTKCWASSSGFDELDPLASKLAIFAQVEQGGMPVINATIE